MNINTLDDLNSANVLKYISKDEIYKKYLNSNFKYNRVFSSPFRKDKKPSFIIWDFNRNYLFKDFATGESGDCFEFVKKLYNVSFYEALKIIINDFSISDKFYTNNNSFISEHKIAEFKSNYNTEYSSGEIKIKIKRREFQNHDLEFWNKFYINQDALIKAHIVPISHFFINNLCFVAEKYSYAYIENKDGLVTYKIYQPYSKFRKFLSNNNYSVWELWSLLPEKGKNLIITSSRKDALSIMCISGIPSISLQAESIFPKEKIMDELKSRFENIYLFYDNDLKSEKNWGQILAEKLLTKYDYLKNIKIDDNYNSKDFSDLVSNHNDKVGLSFLNKKINEE